MEHEWSACFGGRKFISDLGHSEEAEVDGVVTSVERYAVWAPQGKGHRIVEVGGNLEELCHRHGIPSEDVCLLVREVGM